MGSGRVPVSLVGAADAHASVVSSADTEGMSTWILDIVASREEAPVVPREYLNLLEHGWEARQQ
jgi:hypothetical protein